MKSAEPYLAARLARLRTALAQKRLPALLVTAFPDVSYLTGFEGDDSYLLITPGRTILLSDSRYAEQIQREAPWIEALIRQKGLVEELAKLLKQLDLHHLGVQAESMTLKLHAALLKQAKRLQLTPVDEIVIALRHLKDPHEIELIEHAILIAEQAFQALQRTIHVGMTENEVAAVLTHEMRKRGALNSSFDTIVAAGPNASLPHYRPGDVKIGPNTPVLIDWGARFHGYVSDLTRMLYVGQAPPKIRQIHRVVLKAQLAAIAAVKPGKTGRQIDKIARDIITQAGFGKQFGHGLGHGIGRDIHEAIGLSKLSTTVLKPGMVVTVEPGIYLPGIGGVRIEDDVLVTEQGCRVLSSLPKKLP